MFSRDKNNICILLESTFVTERDSFVHNAHLSSNEASHFIQRTSVSTDHTYNTYADEPLATTMDTLSTQHYASPSARKSESAYTFHEF